MRCDGANAEVSCRRLRPLLGTWVAIEGWAANPHTAEAGVVAAYAAVDAIGQLMHPGSPAGDLAAIANAAVAEIIPIDTRTWNVLEFSQRLCRESQGVFDPCLPPQAGIENLQLLEGRRVVKRAALQIDLGGVAKGYAIDCAIDALKASGCSSGVVNAGGDLRVFGPRPQAIVLRLSDGREPYALSLVDAACAVTDPNEMRRPSEHRGYYNRWTDASCPEMAHPERELSTDSHEPRSLAPAVVVAETAMVADALTKCVLLSSAVRADAVLAAFQARRIHL